MTAINLMPYHEALAGLRAAGVEVREIRHGDNLAIRMRDSRGEMKPATILAVIERWREMR